MSSLLIQLPARPASDAQDVITLQLTTLGARAEVVAARLRCHPLTQGVTLQFTEAYALHPTVLQPRRRLQRALLACQH